MHPAKHGKFIGRLEGKRKKEAKKKVSKFFSFCLQETKRSFSFAPALRDKRKTRNYVRRHIELTAVLSYKDKAKEIRAVESRDSKKNR